jgi:hypothetical protein
MRTSQSSAAASQTCSHSPQPAGAIHAGVTLATICSHSYSRPGSPVDYEEDHLVPLSIGAPRNLVNLWPEPR